MSFSRAVIDIDPEEVERRTTEGIRKAVRVSLRRKGAIIAVSGGIDSSLCLALCARALGKDNVFALLLPDKDSSDDSRRLAQILVDQLGVPHATHDITSFLEAAGAYRYQADAIRNIFPEFSEDWKFKIVLPSILASDRLSVSRLVVQKPDGPAVTERMPVGVYLQLVAATNFKQRTRTMMSYFHADRLNYAVCGTPNRLEYDQGFFVKGGDGLADFKPIAHLYKTQVFALARHMGVPEEICGRTPTTDTFSIQQTQEEFYFSLPYDVMDLCLFGHNNGVPTDEVAEGTGLSVDQVKRVFQDIEAKRRTTLPLHLPPVLVEEVHEVADAVRNATGS